MMRARCRMTRSASDAWLLLPAAAPAEYCDFDDTRASLIWQHAGPTGHVGAIIKSQSTQTRHRGSRANTWICHPPHFQWQDMPPAAGKNPVHCNVAIPKRHIRSLLHHAPISQPACAIMISIIVTGIDTHDHCCNVQPEFALLTSGICTPVK